MPATLTRSFQPAAPLPTRWLYQAWDFLLRVGELRAASELERLATLYAHTNPELAQQLRQQARTPLPR
jgi:hypothetical protein